MKRPSLNIVIFCSLLLFGLVGAFAQAPGGHPPGPPVGGSGAPLGPPGGPGAPGPNGNPPGSNTSTAVSGTKMVTTSTGVRLGPSGRWWDNGGVRKAVGVRSEQQRKMDAIFDANKPEIIRTYLAFEKQRAALTFSANRLRWIKRECLRPLTPLTGASAALEKANTQMLLDIRAQLDPKQLAKLDSLQ